MGGFQASEEVLPEFEELLVLPLRGPVLLNAVSVVHVELGGVAELVAYTWRIDQKRKWGR